MEKPEYLSLLMPTPPAPGDISGSGYISTMTSAPIRQAYYGSSFYWVNLVPGFW